MLICLCKWNSMADCCFYLIEFVFLQSSNEWAGFYLPACTFAEFLILFSELELKIEITKHTIRRITWNAKCIEKHVFNSKSSTIFWKRKTKIVLFRSIQRRRYAQIHFVVILRLAYKISFPPLESISTIENSSLLENNHLLSVYFGSESQKYSSIALAFRILKDYMTRTFFHWYMQTTISLYCVIIVVIGVVIIRRQAAIETLLATVNAAPLNKSYDRFFFSLWFDCHSAYCCWS